MRRNTAILLDAINKSHGAHGAQSEGHPGSDGQPGAQLFGNQRNFGHTPGAKKSLSKGDSGGRDGGAFGAAGTHEHHQTYQSYADLDDAITRAESDASDPFAHVKPMDSGRSGTDLIGSQMSGPNVGYMSPSAAAFHRIQGLGNKPAD